MDKISCIYKITSPSGKVYIGQTSDFTKRIRKYKYLDCKEQPRVYRSFLKYGFENHIIECICICEGGDLNSKERYFQEKYNSIGENGLNCMLVTSDNVCGCHSQLTKNKIRASSTGRRVSELTLEKMKVASKNRIGIKEHMNKIRKLRIKYKHSDESKRKMSIARKGRIFTKEHICNLTQSKIGKKRDPEKTRIRALKRCKILLNINTGVYYIGIKEAAFSIGISTNTLYGALGGKYKNKYPIICT